MKILFKNTTQYTKEVYNKFTLFHEKKYGLKYRLYTIFIVMLIISCIILQVAYHNYSIAIILSLAITLFVAFRIFEPIISFNKQVKSETISNEKIFTFYFYNDYFKITTGNTYSTFRYNELYKIFETDEFFYLYSDKTHSFLIQKNNFKIGNSTKFSEFIKNKCKFKFQKVSH